MTRLFLSLYAFITLSLIVLSGVLNHFFVDDDTTDPSLQHLLKSLGYMHQQGLLNPTSMANIGLQSRILDSRFIPWSEADQAALAEHKPIVLYNVKSMPQAYFKLDPNNILEIDLSSSLQQSDTWLVYSALFFFLLAIGTAIWVRPLWRDLQRLQRAAQPSNLHDDNSVVGLTAHSLVYPIGQALDDLKAKVKELLKTQMELTGALAHEFRTPLSRLKFALDAANIEDSETLTMINQDILELEKLMHEMLSYASLENQAPELNISEIPLRTLCEQRADAFSGPLPMPSLRPCSIKIVGENYMLLGDEHFIQRALDNLLQNALRHAHSAIEIHIKCSNGRLIVSVDDDGKGVAPEHIDNIFAPFFRPDQGRDRNQGGAGLGLAIVKRIAHWHNAVCWAEPSQLGGARFSISFKQN